MLLNAPTTYHVQTYNPSTSRCAQRQGHRHRKQHGDNNFYFLATTMVPTFRGLAQINFNLLGVGLPFAMSRDRAIKHVNGIV